MHVHILRIGASLVLINHILLAIRVRVEHINNLFIRKVIRALGSTKQLYLSLVH